MKSSIKNQLQPEQYKFQMHQKVQSKEWRRAINAGDYKAVKDVAFLMMEFRQTKN